MGLTLFGDWIATRAVIRNEFKITVSILEKYFSFS
jgi:hypothetical protein